MAANIFVLLQTREGGPAAAWRSVWINRDHVKRVDLLPGLPARVLVTFDDGTTAEIQGSGATVAAALDH